MHDLAQQLSDFFEAAMAALVPLIFFGGIIGIWLGQRSIDRSRVEGNLAGYGWRLLSMERRTTFFSRSSQRRYNVTYQTHTGAVIRAECRLSWLGGVQWVSNTPFGF